MKTLLFLGLVLCSTAAQAQVDRIDGRTFIRTLKVGETSAIITSDESKKYVQINVSCVAKDSLASEGGIAVNPGSKIVLKNQKYGSESDSYSAVICQD